MHRLDILQCRKSKRAEQQYLANKTPELPLVDDGGVVVPLVCVDDELNRNPLILRYRRNLGPQGAHIECATIQHIVDGAFVASLPASVAMLNKREKCTLGSLSPDRRLDSLEEIVVVEFYRLVGGDEAAKIRKYLLKDFVLRICGQRVVRQNLLCESLPELLEAIIVDLFCEIFCGRR